jgi:biotin carboxyl carrier protein
MQYNLATNGQNFEYKKEGEKIELNGEELSAALNWVKPGEFLNLNLNHNTYRIIVVKKEGKSMRLSVNGHMLDVSLSDSLDVLLKNLGLDKMMNKGIGDVKSPMPGLVLKVLVKAGDVIKKGDPLLILEAMKMENVIKSPTDGPVKEVKVSEKQAVEKNALMIVF